MEPPDYPLEKRNRGHAIEFRGQPGSGQSVIDGVGLGCTVHLRLRGLEVQARVLDVFPDRTFIGTVLGLGGTGEESCRGITIGDDITFRPEHVFACDFHSAVA